MAADKLGRVAVNFNLGVGVCVCGGGCVYMCGVGVCVWGWGSVFTLCISCTCIYHFLLFRRKHLSNWNISVSTVINP